MHRIYGTCANGLKSLLCNTGSDKCQRYNAANQRKTLKEVSITIEIQIALNSVQN